MGKLILNLALDSVLLIYLHLNTNTALLYQIFFSQTILRVRLAIFLFAFLLILIGLMKISKPTMA